MKEISAYTSMYDGEVTFSWRKMMEWVHMGIAVKYSVACITQDEYDANIDEILDY